MDGEIFSEGDELTWDDAVGGLVRSRRKGVVLRPDLLAKRDMALSAPQPVQASDRSAEGGRRDYQMLAKREPLSAPEPQREPQPEHGTSLSPLEAEISKRAAEIHGTAPPPTTAAHAEPSAPSPAAAPAPPVAPRSPDESDPELLAELQKRAHDGAVRSAANAIVSNGR